jgi:hypothetical protein
MASRQQQKGRDGVLSTLDIFIQALNFAKDSCVIPPAQTAFGSASVLLTMIRACFLSLREDKLLTRVYLSRTRWLTIGIISTLGGFALMYAKHSTRNCRGDNQTNSTNPSLMRLEC